MCGFSSLGTTTGLLPLEPELAPVTPGSDDLLLGWTCSLVTRTLLLSVAEMNSLACIDSIPYVEWNCLV